MLYRNKQLQIHKRPSSIEIILTQSADMEQKSIVVVGQVQILIDVLLTASVDPDFG